MTRAEIIQKVYEKVGFPKRQTVELVDLVFETMKETLEAGEKLKIAGFGNFTVIQKADRRGRNPKTGEALTIRARRVLTFKPSIILKQAINANNISDSLESI
jgi:integration host factor subunit alpha